MPSMMALAFGQQFSLKVVRSNAGGATIQKVKAANHN
jgi:hypothetical protein